MDTIERLKDEIVEHASLVFIPAHRNVVKELCVLLGYVRRSDVDRLGEISSGMTHDPLELFKAPSYATDRSRFDMLFDADAPNVAEMRSAVFLFGNDPTTPDKVCGFAMEQKSVLSDEALEALGAIAYAIAARLETRITRECPECFTQEAAWTILRKAWSEGNYYFTVNSVVQGVSLCFT